MKQPDYATLVATPVPRDRRVVEPYVKRATAWIRMMVYIFVGIFVVVGLLGGTIDMLGGHSDYWWLSYAKAFGYLLFPAMFLLGPVLLFWSVNRNRLRELGETGQLLPARVSAVERQNFRGNVIFSATVAFIDDSGRHLQASFQGPQVEMLRVGQQVHALIKGSTVGVLWAPDALMMARAQPSALPH